MKLWPLLFPGVIVPPSQKAAVSWHPVKHQAITMPKTASNHQITHKSISVHKEQAKQGAFASWLTCQLCQEVIFHTLQEPPRLSFLLYCISSRNLLSWSPPKEQGLVNMRLLTAVYRIFYLPLQDDWAIYNRPTMISALLAFLLILTHKHATLSSPTLSSSKIKIFTKIKGYPPLSHALSCLSLLQSL